jgi:hypothetical protein
MYRIDSNSGLGDKGHAGIEQFKAQHQCNEVCYTLSFPRFSSTKPAPVSPVKRRVWDTGTRQVHSCQVQLLFESDNVASDSEASAEEESNLPLYMVTLTSGGYSPEGVLGEISGDVSKTSSMCISTRSQSYGGKTTYFSRYVN